MEKIINISFITDDALGTLYSNAPIVTENIRNNNYSSNWLNDMISNKIFELRKATIPDFELKTSADGNYSKVEFDNAIMLYEHLKDLPRYILTDERFWVWLELEKFYKVAVQAMPIKKDTTFEGRWIFKRGKRRGIWFNTFARSYFWVEFTVDEQKEDKYELTRFAFDKIERIRHLTFDSKYRNVVINVIKAEKKLHDKYSNDSEYSETYKKCESNNKVNGNIYTYIRKAISLYGSARMLDFIPDKELEEIIYEKLEKALFEVHKGNFEYLVK